MAKTAILLPYQEMCDMVGPMLADYNELDVMCVEHIHTEQVEQRVKLLEQEGCELIIARGAQARRIRRCTSIPLIEIRIEAQELGVLVTQMRYQIKKENPVIALLGFSNMFTDTSCFDQLFHIQLRRYMVEKQDELAAAAEKAMREGADALIGGETVCAAAERLNIPCLFLQASGESLQRTLSLASRTAYAIDLEKRNSAEINLMLDSTHSGILQLSPEGIIRRANQRAFSLLDRDAKALIGWPVLKAIPGLDKKLVTQVLQGGQEAYTTLTDVYHRTIIVNLVPILVDGYVECVQISLDEGKRIIEMDSNLRRELYQRGFVAQFRFENLVVQDPETEALITLARQIAKYSAPVLLWGETGTGKQIIAQCIHNASNVASNAFVSLDCSAWQPENLDTMLFGSRENHKDAPACLCELAQDGTLYLAHVENLPFETQYKLLNLIRGMLMHNASNRPQVANVRVIASSCEDLEKLVEKGMLRSDLYYALNILNLTLLPLRRRRADIPGWINHYMNESQKKYKRYITMTKGVQNLLQEYDWPGNLEQVSSICERIVLLTPKRRVDEAFVRQQLELMIPKYSTGKTASVPQQTERAIQITALLRQHGGNRQMVADAMGISKTTLWRYMKKYGIEADFSCQKSEKSGTP